MGIKKMDNGGFQRDLEEGTELGLVKNVPKTISNLTSASAGPSTACKTEVCQTARRRYVPPDLSDGPWHRYKTISLIVTIVLLIVWIIVYSVLSNLNLL